MMAMPKFKFSDDGKREYMVYDETVTGFGYP